jgi:type III secretory pathway component EscV
MAKGKVIWLKNAEIQMFAIMDYYSQRNKSKTYSLKLYREIKQKLQNLDFSVTAPQKSSMTSLFYFIHNHISVFFSIQNSDVIVTLIWDERRNPNVLKEVLEDLD